MTSFTAPTTAAPAHASAATPASQAATPAPAPPGNPRMAVVAAVEELLTRTLLLSDTAHELTRLAQDLQQIVPTLVEQLNEATAQDNVWVRVTNVKTPAQVEAQHASAPNDCAWYVVWVGREPGIYITSEEADAQIKGCPGQQYRKRQSKREALALYRDKFCDGQVSKWAEC
ncbi:hypothetical protein K438DRAFT_1769318 [Mycena galopus ATCC 62051]|nr:hypothetical protein K438DRAFT_1769318 [Mycena galopus ATCC 62051]